MWKADQYELPYSCFQCLLQQILHKINIQEIRPDFLLRQ